jgi:outer membrane biosynthesis protein TonB
LSDGARGKVTFDDTTVLFQLVRPLARTPRPRLPASVRRSVLGELDVVFAAVLAATLALHVAVVIYLRQVDWPRRPPVDELPDRFVRQALHLSRTRPQPAQPRPAPPTPSPVHEPRTAPAPSARPAHVDTHAPAPAPSPSPSDRRAILEAQTRRMGVLPLLIARGDTPSSPLADLLASGAVDRPLDEAMRGLTGVQIAGDTSLAHLPAVRDGSGKVGVIDGLRGRGQIAQPADTGAATERRVHADLRVGPPEVEGGRADPQAIAREIRERRKAIASCYERALKQQPTLAGKLVVRFTIAPAGTVASADVDDDTLGAPAVTACVRGTILRWRFTTVGDGPVEVSFPFVFQPGD